MASTLADAPAVNPDETLDDLFQGLAKVGIKPFSLKEIGKYKRFLREGLNTRWQRWTIALSHVCVYLMLATLSIFVFGVLFSQLLMIVVSVVVALALLLIARYLRKQGRDWEDDPIKETRYLPEEAKKYIDQLQKILPGVTFSQSRIALSHMVVYAHLGVRKAAIYRD